ncbi:hypothetical protein [Nocardiopsis sp. TNDT3]|uniref:hypothetical protein n=1 Tax=Nocardiopsis sp. TNDT3 TaxID=2249354 RepID=UPI000E3BDCF3|nr:hypothetical protein [Nocardiopsis sp. TNDT3]
MHKNERTRESASTIATRDCASCSWQIVAGSALLADLEAATHQVQAHTTVPQRLRIRALVESYRAVLGPLPSRLLILAVREVLEEPAPVLALAPVDVDGSWPAADYAQRGAAA